MRRLLRSLSLASLASILLIGGPALAAHRGECRKGAVEKLQASPDGLAVYQAVSDKKFFADWLMCDDAQFGLPTAVHESVHYITAARDAFPLVDGGEVQRPHEVSKFFAPSKIAKKFRADDDYASTYLRPGRASSSGDFLNLLDELNAYTHDLNAAVDLKGLTRENESIDHRDGLAALMAFVALYVERAEASDPDTWSGLQQPEVSKTLATLWDHAEKVMSSSCGIPRYGTNDKSYIRKFCAPAAQASLQTVIGRAPVCPTDCLKTAEAEESGDESMEPSPPDLGSRTIWSSRKARRVKSSEDSETVTPGSGG